MFVLVLLAVITGVHVYVFRRAGSVAWIARRIQRPTRIGLGVLLWAGFAAGSAFGHDRTGALAAALELFGMSWMGVLFLTATCLLAVDLITLFGWILRRQVARLRGVALLAGALLSSVALLQGMRPPVVREYAVQLPELPASLDGTVVVALSDTHLGSLLGHSWLTARVEQVQALRPDLVFLTGDILEGHGSVGRELLPALRRLTAPWGVYAVPGNHDFYGGGGGKMALLEAAGYRVLRNQWEQVRPGLVVAGVDDLTILRRHRGDPAAALDQALAGRPAGATILLSHTPDEIERAAWAGVDLMLSGHTHGGQIWPFNYLVRLVYPLVAGRYEVAGMTAIVGRGTGTWGPRMRLWHPAEILRITLRSGAATD